MCRGAGSHSSDHHLLGHLSRMLQGIVLPGLGRQPMGQGTPASAWQPGQHVLQQPQQQAVQVAELPEAAVEAAVQTEPSAMPEARSPMLTATAEDSGSSSPPPRYSPLPLTACCVLQR